jgi:ribose 5-phosphate isomerase A
VDAVDDVAAKRAAGEAAASLVEDGMSLGLGTGSTATWFVLAVGARVAAGLRVRGVATSVATEQLAAGLGIELIVLGAEGLDLAVDGADAVDPDLRLIKGAGGAMVREKIVAAAARRFVVVVDESKLCDRLGGVVPVEIVPFGAGATLAALETLGTRFVVRHGIDGTPVLSDNGNLLADGELPVIDDPEGMAERLAAIPGVVGHGLFLGMADLAIAGAADGSVRELRATPALS